MDQTHATDQAGTGGNGARRRRPVLASLTTLGVVASLLGVAGVFAAGSDSATASNNDAFTGDLGGGGEDDVDLELSTATMDYETGAFSCTGDWTDHTDTGIITSNGEELGTQFPQFGMWDEGAMCLRNVGTSDASVTIGVFDLADYELACSPGEADAPDPTCGDEGPGELSSDLVVSAYYADPNLADSANCNSDSTEAQLLASLYDGSASIALRDIPAGGTLAFCLGAGWIGDPVSQSDAASWGFSFDGVLDTDGDPDPEVPADVVCADDDGFEENDWYPTATPFTGESMDALGCTNEFDWYLYEHEGGTLSATLEFDETVIDLDLLVIEVNENGRIDTLADSSSYDSDEAISVDLDPGTYYLVETGYRLNGNEVAPQPYTLTASSFAP